MIEDITEDSIGQMTKHRTLQRKTQKTGKRTG